MFFACAQGVLCAKGKRNSETPGSYRTTEQHQGRRMSAQTVMEKIYILPMADGGFAVASVDCLCEFLRFTTDPPPVAHQVSISRSEWVRLAREVIVNTLFAKSGLQLKLTLSRQRDRVSGSYCLYELFVCSSLLVCFCFCFHRST